MKYLFIDVETTGINPYECAIIQLSGVFIINEEKKEVFDFKLKPFPGARIEEAALEVTGVSRDDLESYPEQYKVYEEFMSLLEKYVDPYNKQDKFFFVAYNALFDMDFIREFFKKNDNNFFGSYFWFPPIDVMMLACEKLKHQRQMLPNFKLATVAKHLGIELRPDMLHNALYDIELTLEVYKLVQNNTQNDQKEEFTPLVETPSTKPEEVLQHKEETKNPNTKELEEKDFTQGLF